MRSLDPSEILHVGAHRITIEPPDTFVLRLVGDLSGEEVARILDRFERCLVGPEPVYLMVDLARLGEAAPEARRITALRELPPAYGGVVLFGGTFQQQLTAKLATTAGWLLRGRGLGKPKPMCVKDEREARAWIAERRTGIEGGQAGSSGPGATEGATRG